MTGSLFAGAVNTREVCEIREKIATHPSSATRALTAFDRLVDDLDWLQGNYNDLCDQVLYLEGQRNDARALLGTALWDEEPWDGERLVELMERVYVELGGDLGGPPDA